MTILGIFVSLNTFKSEDAETDDEIYLGMWGTGGGREFPLSSKNHDDFERGAQDMYILGVDPGFGFTMLRPERSAPGEPNDPALVPIDMGTIQYVYLRKQAYGTGQADNAWRLDSAIVMLFEQETVPLNQPRLFSLFTPKGQWFGNEHGHQVWLPEFRGPDARKLMGRLESKVNWSGKRD
jgi:hypothetical protein